MLTAFFVQTHVSIMSPSSLQGAWNFKDNFMWRTPAISILEFFRNNKLAGRNYSKAIIDINFYQLRCQLQSSMHSAAARGVAGGVGGVPLSFFP